MCRRNYYPLRSAGSHYTLLMRLLKKYREWKAKDLIRRIRVTQRTMERALLEVSLRDQIRNEERAMMGPLWRK
ncbi:jg19075 [Pararge aegeria aegeria]|uniref:Jg19075 protein n=1 Tax=Pararge aegeria aegeria TaxID=348720 RepID=A0A8S4SLM6_9NEOP|nr:jg19075 [Pararge aegeria aegeria]